MPAGFSPVVKGVAPDASPPRSPAFTTVKPASSNALTASSRLMPLMAQPLGTVMTRPTVSSAAGLVMSVKPMLAITCVKPGFWLARSWTLLLRSSSCGMWASLFCRDGLRTRVVCGWGAFGQNGSRRGGLVSHAPPVWQES